MTDVMWKDGTVTYGIPATQLKPAYAVDDFEFWPRMAVTRTKRSLGLTTTDAPVRPVADETKQVHAASDADSLLSTFGWRATTQSPATTGIVLQSDAKERVCKVQFFDESGSVMVRKVRHAIWPLVRSSVGRD